MELLQNLENEGFQVKLIDRGRISVKPFDRLTPELSRKIKAGKPGLVLELTRLRMDQYLDWAIEKLNQVYRPGEPIQPHTEHSRELERRITETFATCDESEFRQAVDSWQAYFMNFNQGD